MEHLRVIKVLKHKVELQNYLGWMDVQTPDGPNVLNTLDILSRVKSIHSVSEGLVEQEELREYKDVELAFSEDVSIGASIEPAWLL